MIDEVLDLFIELGADDDQLEFPVVYASARDGYASLSAEAREGDMRPLLDSILENIAPPGRFKRAAANPFLLPRL